VCRWSLASWHLRNQRKLVIMTELEQYKAMLTRAGYKYDEDTRPDGSISIVVDGEYATWHHFTPDGKLISLGASY